MQLEHLPLVRSPLDFASKPSMEAEDQETSIPLEETSNFFSDICKGIFCCCFRRNEEVERPRIIVREAFPLAIYSDLQDFFKIASTFPIQSPEILKPENREGLPIRLTLLARQNSSIQELSRRQTMLTRYHEHLKGAVGKLEQEKQPYKAESLQTLERGLEILLNYCNISIDEELPAAGKAFPQPSQFDRTRSPSPEPDNRSTPTNYVTAASEGFQRRSSTTSTPPPTPAPPPSPEVAHKKPSRWDLENIATRL